MALPFIFILIIASISLLKGLYDEAYQRELD
jgi:choline-glycine betaine transporter